MKTAFIFPGQGSQYVGMGKDIYEKHPAARKIFDEANEALGWDLKNLCFNGPEEELKKTQNTQPAILTVSVACLEVLREKGVTPDIVAGHSLGEYSALVSAGSISFYDAVRVVEKRGAYMQEAAPIGSGGMAAVLGLDKEKVVEVCQKASKFGIVEPANFNSPGQVVISGELKAVEKAMELAREAGASRVVSLAVSGPFHSSLMKVAGEKLGRELDRITINDPLIPIMANVNADFVRTGLEVKDALVKQVSASVRWDEIIEKMVSMFTVIFVEVGPGKVLSGLVKKINKQSKIFNVEDSESLEKTIANMREVI